VIAEEPFGVAAGLDEAGRELGQSSADDCDWKLALPDAMQCSQDRSKVAGLGELHLVEEERNTGRCLLGRISELEQYFVQIRVELTAISAAALSIDVD